MSNAGKAVINAADEFWSEDNWQSGPIVQWGGGEAAESADGGKTWRKFRLDMTPCPHCGKPSLERIYK